MKKNILIKSILIVSLVIGFGLFLDFARAEGNEKSETGVSLEDPNNKIQDGAGSTAIAVNPEVCSECTAKNAVPGDRHSLPLKRPTAKPSGNNNQNDPGSH